MPIYFEGLGTVQASNTVAIHSQVDGKLQSVNFTEGQRVKTGDMLAIVDPRPFQAVLDQAKAKRAEDQAQLVSDRRTSPASRTWLRRAPARSRRSISSRPRSMP